MFGGGLGLWLVNGFNILANITAFMNLVMGPTLPPS